MFEQLRNTFSKTRAASEESTPIDPASCEFGHKGNQELFEYFGRNSRCESNHEIYERRTHPDVAQALDDLITKVGASDGAMKPETVYGRRIVANAQGLVFAWAGGTSDFFFRLGNHRVEAACRNGARLDPTYPAGWLNFYVTRLGDNWRSVLERWLQVSYEDSSTEQ